MTAQHLIASDERLRSMIHYARTTSMVDHPTYGSFEADVLDALAAHVWDRRIESADALLDAVTALHTRVTDADEYRDPSDDRYDEWRASA